MSSFSNQDQGCDFASFPGPLERTDAQSTDSSSPSVSFGEGLDHGQGHGHTLEPEAVHQRTSPQERWASLACPARVTADLLSAALTACKKTPLRFF